MNIHYLQHVPFEGLGSIEQWAIANGHQLSLTRLYAGDHLPAMERFDMLIVLGGPMSVHDEFEHVWLKAEKWFVRQAIDAGKPVLGICLGAQIIAEVLGGAVEKAQEKEIGWFPITLKEAFAETELGRRLLPQSEVFHWHGETFTLPEGAQPIASSEACENQGFIFNDTVIALQCHLETTHLSASSIIDNSRAELVEGRYIQSEEEMLNDPRRYSQLAPLMAIVMEYLAEHAGAG